MGDWRLTGVDWGYGFEGEGMHPPPKIVHPKGAHAFECNYSPTSLTGRLVVNVV